MRFKRHKNIISRFDAAKYVAPKFTMRAKVSFGAQIRTKMSENNITSGPIDIGVAKHENPKYSIRMRTCKLMQMPGQTTDSIPGPGTYPVPSTTSFDHPALPMPGRTTMKGIKTWVCCWHSVMQHSRCKYRMKPEKCNCKQKVKVIC